ncbi:cytochrome b/b6 domain-containing protein [Gleimia hominis]|uniref:cytochrome b/b6 domain-containing protein n=1 Tax=Gleimia hominis TaxID=595468 RepID=UPI000C8104BD|nr:cytochrome b/b6 domain-containing protein [Gleimia hominis]WIK65334.1 cytochrome b/b6 domain-containing protein [Gleimia hominis]
MRKNSVKSPIVKAAVESIASHRYAWAGAALALLALVVAACLSWNTAAVQHFVSKYPGVATGAEFEGNAAWVCALHALNIFFMALIVKTGMQVRFSRRGAGYLKPKWPRKSPKVSVLQFTHVLVDVLWMVSGLGYVVLMFISGRWVRLIPTSWDVFAHSASVALQYLSFHWPADNGWIAYNALQMLAYFAVVFILTPLAIITGWRMSTLWPKKWNRAFPMPWARAIHFPTMIAYGLFVVVHLVLVASTGLIQNLNHMFAARNDNSLWGLVVAVVVLALTAFATWGLKPVLMRTFATLFGRVTRR